MRGESLELVRRGDEGQLGDLGNALGDLLGEADRRVETGADGGAALRQLVEAGKGEFDAADGRGDLSGIAAEFLAERQRGGVCLLYTSDAADE